MTYQLPITQTLDLEVQVHTITNNPRSWHFDLRDDLSAQEQETVARLRYEQAAIIEAAGEQLLVAVTPEVIEASVRGAEAVGVVGASPAFAVGLAAMARRMHEVRSLIATEQGYPEDFRFPSAALDRILGSAEANRQELRMSRAGDYPLFSYTYGFTSSGEEGGRFQPHPRLREVFDHQSDLLRAVPYPEVRVAPAQLGEGAVLVGSMAG